MVQLGGGNRAQLLAATALGLIVVGLFACGVPVRRALRVEPTEALRHAGRPDLHLSGTGRNVPLPTTLPDVPVSVCRVSTVELSLLS